VEFVKSPELFGPPQARSPHGGADQIVGGANAFEAEAQPAKLQLGKQVGQPLLNETSQEPEMLLAQKCPL
jgi:hypothetical protein